MDHQQRDHGPAEPHATEAYDVYQDLQIAARAWRRVAVPEPRFEPSHEVVQEVHGVVNPDKLAHLGPVLPLAYGRRQRDRTGSAEQEEGHEDDHN